MKRFVLTILFLYSAIAHAENYRLTKPEAWQATTIEDAIEKLYDTNITEEDNGSRIMVTLPKLAENGGSIPLRIRTTIPAKSIAVLQGGNVRSLTTVFTVHGEPNYSIRIKLAQTAIVVIIVEGKDGKFYSKKLKVDVSLGGCGNGLGAGNPHASKKTIYSSRAAIRASYPVQRRTITPKVEREKYNSFNENQFKEVASSPLSTFSTDVDTASYSNVRSYIMDRKAKPSKDAVRSEEMINYFNYSYQEPKNNDPFAINLKMGQSIWNKETKIIQIGLQTKRVDIASLPASNLVFLLDVSGSMSRPESLPLLIKSLKLLTKELRKKDRVSIVVYAGNSGLVLDRARGDEKEKIYQALERLNAGGSTAGGRGIRLAYEVAQKAFIDGGNNRIILATDGDFNVGVSSRDGLIKLIEEKRKSGVFLSVLGFGRGNMQDNTMEQIADHGNGNYAYIDTLLEAKKVLVTQMSGTLYTVAKDVKVQVEFNPSKVHAYRLIGYENRVMENEDFNNDKKDAAEIGMGHSVTALYEVILQKDGLTSKVDELKYQKNTSIQSEEIATVKIRYKQPDGNTSMLMSKVVDMNSDDIDPNAYSFAQSVAGFGMLLRESEYKNSLTYKTLIEIAKDAKGTDREGYRAEFIRMLELSELLE